MVKYLALADCCVDSNYYPQGAEFWRDTKFEETPTYLEIVEEQTAPKRGTKKAAEDDL